MSEEQIERLTGMLQRLEALLVEGARLRQQLEQELLVSRLSSEQLDVFETHPYPRLSPETTARPFAGAGRTEGDG